MPVLAEGKKAPAVKGLVEEGVKKSLTDLMGKKGVILYFYPKDSTPGCTIQANDFTGSIAKFRRAGYEVVGVSRDSLASHCKFTEKFGLKIPLISDEDEVICKKFDVIKEKNMYGKKVMGIERSTFVIGNDGKIQKIYRKVKAKGHAEQVLEDVKSL